MSQAVALTCGEPSGVGIEIAQAAWHWVRRDQPYFVIADSRHFRPREGGPEIVRISRPDDAPRAMAEGLPVLHFDFPSPAEPGVIDPSNARATIAAIELAATLALKGEAAAVCTNPISKKALAEGAGFSFPGHTEFLAHLCGVEQSAMMLACPGLRVVPATTHLPLASVPRILSGNRIDYCVRTCADALRTDFGVRQPRIAVAGLNPHAGEGGTMGGEERAVIAPAIERLRDDGLSVSGPHPADSMFHESARSEYDAAICMYHDQALIPLKTLDFFGAINVTLGLPIIRVSPAHGTAMDLAGRGIARPDSLANALLAAGRFARARRAAA